jgi:hypothetical protein
MKILPDPRVYAPFSANSLVRLARQGALAGSATQHRNSAEQLVAAIEQSLRAGDDALIEEALAESGSPEEFRILGEALEAALIASRDDAAVHLRLFALPIVIVTGGLAPSSVAGVLTDGAQIKSLFEAHGTLGQLNNFGLSSALSSAAGLEMLKPAAIYRLARQAETGLVPWLDIPPEPIRVTSVAEVAHLRFLTGVSVAPAGAPGFAESAGNIGGWGMPLTRLLAAQLGQPGLSLLPIPRPPMSPRRALEAGLFAQREIGLQLFLSTALRGFRAQVGEAQAFVCACADASVHIRLRSPFDTAPAREYVWKLQPGDDLAAIGSSIYSLLDECRVAHVQSAEAIEPA